MRYNSRQPQEPAPKGCFFSINDYKEVDYKDAVVLRKFTSSYAKIKPQRKTGLSSKFQRKLSTAIKRARFMSLMPYTRR